MKFTREELEHNFDTLMRLYPQDKSKKSIANILVGSHGTSFANTRSIVNDGRIDSYKRLGVTHPNVIKNNKLTTTDILDVKLGLDQYVFLTLGRATISELVTHYFLFDNTIVNTQNSLVSLLEIAELGAVVSEESRIAQGFTKVQTDKLNELAVKIFRNSVVAGHNFNELFDGFYQKHFTDILQYASTLEYPEETPLKKEPFFMDIAPRQGPQLMIPRSLLFEQGFFAVVDVYNKGMVRPGKYVRKEQIVSLDQVITVCFGSSIASLMKVYGTHPTNKKIYLINTVFNMIGEMRALGVTGGNIQTNVIDYMKSVGFQLQ